MKTGFSQADFKKADNEKITMYHADHWMNALENIQKVMEEEQKK